MKELNFQETAEGYSEPCQTFSMDIFVKILNGWEPWTAFTKTPSSHFWLSSEYASVMENNKRSSKNEALIIAKKSNLLLLFK